MSTQDKIKQKAFFLKFLVLRTKLFLGLFFCALIFSCLSLYSVWSAWAGIQFDPPISYSVLLTPNSIAVGDLNGDGFIDAAVGNGFGKIEVFINNASGDGQFKPKVQYPSSGVLYPNLVMKIADIDLVNKPDLITLGSVGSANGFSVLLNNGNGTFLTPVSTETTLTLAALTVANFNINNDSYVDVAVIDRYGKTLNIYLGNGDGTFGALYYSFDVGNIQNFEQYYIEKC